MKFKFPTIRHFRDVIRQYNQLGIHQKVKLVGYPKIHGANASILFTGPGSYEIHSKEAEIIPPMEFLEFEKWVPKNESYLLGLGLRVLEDSSGALDYPFVIAGEWAGGGIQKKSSVHGLPKFFTVVAVGNVREEIDPQIGAYNAIQFQTFPSFNLTNKEVGIYDIRDFGRYEIELDVSFPELIQNQLGELTVEVEKACPVAKYFGVDSDRGEGIVWQAQTNSDRHLFFKVKGAKHSVVKVRTLASVSPEKISSILEFVEYACTENRKEQGVFETGPIAKERLSVFVKWVIADIVKEESDTMVNNSIDIKDVGDRIAANAIAWYKTKLNQ